MGGILSVKTEPIDWTIMVYDPKDRTRDYWPDGLFSTGVNISLVAKHSRKLGGRSSNFTLNGIYSSAESINLGEILLPPELQTGVKQGSWHASFQFAHFLKENPAKPGDGWGFFAKIGVSDGNPNPVQAFFTGGFGGNRLFPGRPRDTFGLGYFYYDLSDELQSTIGRQVFRDEQGVEAFYNFHITPWMQLTGDLQYVSPARARNKNAFTGGVRLKFRF